MPDNSDGCIVALLPAADDPTVAASSEPAHITMVWLGTVGDLAEGAEAAILEQVKAYAADASGPITASVDSRGELGDDKADVLFLEGEGLRAYRDGLMTGAVAEQAGLVEQYPEWTPHLTLGYPETPAREDYDAEEVVFGRLALWIGDEYTDFPLGGEAGMEEETEGAEPEMTEEEIAAETASLAAEMPVPIHGVLAPLEAMSGDMRIFSADGMTWRDLPLPLKWMKADKEGHDDSVIVANIEQIKVVDNLVLFAGHMASNAEAAEVIQLRADNAVRGVSVDLDMAEHQFEKEDGSPVDIFAEPMDPDEKIVQRVTTGRIAAATICAIPAFQEAYFDIGTWDEALDSAEECEDCDNEKAPAEGEPLAATGEGVETFAPGTKDGPGWITDPIPTARIRRYWTKGEGAAKINWGVPGDFNRCRSQLAKYIANPEWLAGTCANMHKEALGVWPGGETGRHSQEEVVTASGEMAPAFRMIEDQDALVAAGAQISSGWFADPQLEGPTPLTITDEGQVYGHAATWGQCHIGSDRCVTAPKSSTDYAYFHTGAVKTDQGEIPVGHITMGTGHAKLSDKAAVAAAHYDNTGAVVADVHAGEDKHGIWLAGALRPDVTEEQIHALRAAAISGDWRRIGAGMEMVAALAVNVPGFPIPRTAIAASGLVDDALVAAAVVQSEEVTQDDVFTRFAEKAIEQYEARQGRKARAASLREFANAENKERAEALRAALGEED